MASETVMASFALTNRIPWHTYDLQKVRKRLAIQRAARGARGRQRSGVDQQLLIGARSNLRGAERLLPALVAALVAERRKVTSQRTHEHHVDEEASAEDEVRAWVVGGCWWWVGDGG